ncbi:CYTH domain-containing protein [Lacticigenium naphthae]|uniref:CYTH domain-containing protein n=1 Tax=Lacticigenium naphthae TaxID=515351 RepID=UPI000418B741|nr:CYTH domain-containing protein [Lacticigenium naphthae]
MSENKEIEFKSLLLNSEYDRLLNYFQLDKVDKQYQINHYFDTNNLDLKEKRSALRIRIINDNHAEITLKTPEDNYLLETSEDLTVDAAKRMIQSNTLEVPISIQTVLQNIGINSTNLKKIATLETNRIEKDIPEGLLVLDESHYKNIVDYELELEVTNYEKGKVDFLNFLASHKLPYRKARNKIARAYDVPSNLDN